MKSTNSLYTLPLTINASVDTMMEHLAIKQTPVAADSRNKLIAIHRSSDTDAQHKTDLIGIRQQAHPELKDATQTLLMHYFEDPKSASGWSHIETPLGDVFDPSSKEKLLSGVRELSGFHQNGITYLFVQYQSPVVQHSYSVKILWSVMQNGRPVWHEKKWDHKGDDARSVLASVRQLSIHRRNDGQHVLYGVTRGFGDPELGRGEEEFFMMLPRPPSNTSRITQQDIVFDTLHDADHEIPNWDGIENASIYQLATPLDGEADSDANRYTLLRLRKGKIEFHTTRVLPTSRFYAQPRLSFESGSIQVDSQGIDLSDARILAVPAGIKDALLVHQPNGDLGLLENIHSTKPNYRSLLQTNGIKNSSPANIDRLSVGVVGNIGDKNASLAIFATPATQQTLWLMRLDGQRNTHSWVCLGDQVSDMACPRVMPDGAELFQVSPMAGKIEFKRQNAVTHTWTTTELAVATSDLSNVTPINTHVIDIEVSDANFIPCSGHDITLTCDIPCLLYIDGMTHRVGPRLPLTLTSNSYGRIRGVIPTNGLKAPKFTVDAPNAPTINVMPNGRISERLAGNAKGFNVSRRIAELAPPEHRSEINQLIKSYGDAASKSKRGISCDGTLRTQYRMSAQGKGTFINETAIGQTLNAIPIAGFSGDILNHIRQGFEDIKQLIVRVFDASVEFLIQIGNEIFKFTNTLFDTIIDGFEALADFLSGVFEKLGKVVEDVAKKILEAVSFVFGGADVFAANDALQVTIKAGFLTTSTAVAQLGRTVNAKYQKQIDLLDEQLDSLINQAQQASNIRSASAEQGISFAGVHIPAPSALVKTNRAGSDIMGGNQTKLDDIETTTTIPKNEAEVLNNFINRLQSNYEKDVASVIQDIGRLLDSDNTLLEKLSAMPLELLRLLKGVIKTIAKLAGDALEAALELVNILVGRLFEALESDIDIPFLKTLVQLWSGDSERKLSYFDILTLPFAFIGTAIWKIVSGKAIFTPEETKGFLPWVENLPQTMDLSALIQGEKIPKHKSLGAAATSDSSTQNNASAAEIKIFLQRLTALSILAAVGGILVGLTAKPVATMAEVAGTEAGIAGKLVTFMSAIPLVITLIYELTSMFFQAIDGTHIPSGKSMTTDEKNSAILKLVFTLIILTFAIISAIIAFIMKIPSLISNLVMNIISIITGVCLLGYSIYKIVDHANALDTSDKEEDQIWGIGLEAASGIASIIGIGSTVSVILASKLSKAEGVSATLMTIVAIGLQVTDTLISQASTIVAAGRTHQALA
ncbi:MAG: hypothetical protein VB954_12385 [Thalassolituus sp.]|uniref:hypothetical protein n=1 Tax=Thalassolituus sp. TaxID=2030822 RepID=UPI003982B4DA